MRAPEETKEPPKRRILVADDDEHTRNLLRDLCDSAGYQVMMAADGDDTLALIEAQAPDLVLLDLMMPRKDGFSVLRELRESSKWADLPVVILTAMGDMDGKIRGMELGADDYVTKPFKLIELQTRVNSALLVREYRKKLMAAEEELAQLRAVDPVTGRGRTRSSRRPWTGRSPGPGGTGGRRRRCCSASTTTRGCGTSWAGRSATS